MASAHSEVFKVRARPICRSGESVGCEACCFGQHGQFEPVPAELAGEFAPAQYLLREWQDYYFRCPAADSLRVGNRSEARMINGLFQVWLKNYLGLTTLQPYKEGKPLIPAVHVEVLSSKFANPSDHIEFLRPLLDELFERAARLPFTFHAPTQRGVGESLCPPTPLFTWHFFCRYAERLRGALSLVLAEPHRRLKDAERFVHLKEVTESDADVFLSILHHPSELVPADGRTLTRAFGRYAPRRVWQRLPEETFDTPENRFVCHFLRQLLSAGDNLFLQSWWPKADSHRVCTVRGLLSMVRRALRHPVFSEVGPMERFPSTSRVLMRREGYRDLLELWRLFHLARRPLFQPLAEAIDLRDIATLYEIWVFFEFVEELAKLTGQSPELHLSWSDEHGVEWQSEVRFGSAGTLRYNRSFGREESYSLPMRPDFTWSAGGGTSVVLDAKFRMESFPLDAMVEDEEDSKEEHEHQQPTESIVRRADLYKMHTYRDALKGVKASVAVYPGDVSIFYDCRHGRVEDITLEAILFGGLSGIGAIVRRPGATRPDTIKA